MRKEIQGMLCELPSLLTMRFQQVRCKDAILIRAAEENELSMTGAPKVIPDACIASGCTASNRSATTFTCIRAKSSIRSLLCSKNLHLQWEKISMRNSA